MKNIITFYLKESPDSEGRWLEEILQWPDDQWEFNHDFIQWLFPLDQPSAYNPDAPLLDDNAIHEFYRDKLLQANLRTSYERWLRFCGIERVEGKLHLADAKPDVWDGFNHNWLRITRVLRCLTLLGLIKEAKEFFGLLVVLRESQTVAIDGNTFGFWERAVTLP